MTKTTMINLHERLYRGDKFNPQYKILIFGAGALGGNLCENLARMGFQKLAVVDFDKVEEHNCSTQPYGIDNIGQYKVDALHQRLFRDLRIDIDADKTKVLNGSQFDYLVFNYVPFLIIDAFDNATSRALLRDTRVLHMGLNAGFAEVTWDKDYVVPKDGADTCDYPLARDAILLAVATATEEICRYIVGEPMQNYVITLQDLKITPA